MDLRKSAVLLALVSLLLPASTMSAFAAEPAAPAWQADDLIEALDVEPDADTSPRYRGIRRPDQPVAAPTTGGGVVSDLKILFEFDSADLTPQAKRTLDELAVALASDRLRDSRFRIAGHTDAVGDETYNLDLSRRRAEAVVEYLEREHGITRARLASEGVGEKQLVDPTNPNSAANRRVEVVNLAREEG